VLQFVWIWQAPPWPSDETGDCWPSQGRGCCVGTTGRQSLLPLGFLAGLDGCLTPSPKGNISPPFERRRLSVLARPFAASSSVARDWIPW